MSWQMPRVKVNSSIVAILTSCVYIHIHKYLRYRYIEFSILFTNKANVNIARIPEFTCSTSTSLRRVKKLLRVQLKGKLPKIHNSSEHNFNSFYICMSDCLCGQICSHRMKRRFGGFLLFFVILGQSNGDYEELCTVKYILD